MKREKKAKVTKWINRLMAVSPMKYKTALISNGRPAEIGEAITPNAKMSFSRDIL